MVEKCIEKYQGGPNESDLESTESITDLTGPGILLPSIFIILVNRILLGGILGNMIPSRFVVMLEDCIPNLWICVTPLYYYLKNPILRLFVWRMVNRMKITSVEHHNNDIELNVMPNI